MPKLKKISASERQPERIRKGIGARVGNIRCSICTHTERHRIETLCASGASIKSVARQYSVSHHSVHTHWKRHVLPSTKAALVMGPVVARDMAARVAEENKSVLDHLKFVRAGLYHLFDIALEAGDVSLGGIAAGRLHENLNLVARLTGELASSPLVQVNNNTNILASPQFAELQATLVGVLAKYPDARREVIQAFRKLEERSAPLIEAKPDAQAAAKDAAE